MSLYLKTPDISKQLEELPLHPYNFPLDPFQQHAIAAISKDENVLVCAKTGSGKTLVGEYQIYHSLKKGKRVFYTTPIKSLSNQKFHDLKTQFKDASVGIMTGDIKFCPDAQIVIMTTEILRNLLYKKGTTTEHLGLTASISLDDLDAVIFDECHYINDKDRGKIWEETMILLPKDINLVLLSATLDHPEYFAEWLGELKQKSIHLIQTHYRIVPLTHNVLTDDYKLLQIMDAKEVYNEKVYIDWLRNRQNQKDNKKDFQKKVHDARQGGVEGAIDGKVVVYSFIHQMNNTIKMLDSEGHLPALFFVLSRKQCENYASKVEGTLLDTSDTAAVKHIISFHLHRHMKSLEKAPQYHQIYDLLCRGIAFHHSGLMPLLKEIIEILFSKGYVRVMFCTETFAVGLNMPTKTVLFAGYHKYDDATEGMRVLRTDEYIQMAGRAGRRGKDTQGIVIYLPDKQPVTSAEMKSMMKGNRPPILSRMDFHYDFILKTLQAGSVDWKNIMERSYWFQQRQKEIKGAERELKHLNGEMEKLKIDDVYLEGCKMREDIENKHKEAVNSSKKELQRQLDTLKNKQFGPKWVMAWDNYKKLRGFAKEKEEVETYLTNLQQHENSIKPVVDFLYNIGYISHNNHMALSKNDLTLKGILATEINEGHQILMTELYNKELAHDLAEDELVAVLALFQGESDENAPSIQSLDIPSQAVNVLKQIDAIAKELQLKEDKVGYPMKGYWDMSTTLIEPMYKWINGENASIICSEYGIFEGNFIRSIMKIANMLDEWMAMATYCQHVNQIDKIISIKEKLIRDIVISDSLYLHI